MFECGICIYFLKFIISKEHISKKIINILQIILFLNINNNSLIILIKNLFEILSRF